MTNSLADIVVKATPGEWKVFDHYCGRDPEAAGEEYANTRLIGLGQFDTIAEVRMGSDDVDGDFEANAELFAKAKSLATLVLEAREELGEARTTLSILRTQIIVEIGRCADPAESRWEGVPDKLRERLDAIDATLAKLEAL